VLQTGNEFVLVLQKGALNRLTPDQIPNGPAIVIQKGLHAEPTVIPLKRR
jgi:hypothetical protein